MVFGVANAGSDVLGSIRNEKAGLCCAGKRWEALDATKKGLPSLPLALRELLDDNTDVITQFV